MSYIKRALEDKIMTLSAQFSVLLLTGHRQVGKTTLLQKIASKERTYVSFDDLNLRNLAKTEPKLFLQQFKTPVIFDEIQYVPELLPYIKIEVDKSKQPGMFWLTGSQQFQLMKNISESLAGRVAIVKMLGLSYREIHNNISENKPFLPSIDYLSKKDNIADLKEIFRQIFYGSMPAVNSVENIDLNIFFNSYIQTYITRDLRELTQVADLQKFVKFIKVLAARTGQLLNYSSIARDCDISVPTAKNWLSILETSSLIYVLKPFYSNITNRLIKMPKVYFTDTGLCSYLTGWNSPETLMNGALAGQIFETFVVVEILKSYWNAGIEAPLYFYRDKDGSEIDLLIEQNQEIYPIEIKLSANVSKNQIKNFKYIAKIAKIKTGLIACLTDIPQYIDENNIAVNVGQI